MIRWVRQGEPPDIAMTTYMPFDREEPFLLPPDVKDWLPANDIAHFYRLAAVERSAALAAFHTNARPSGKPQYHPRLMMLALLVYSYANERLLRSRRIERATYRDTSALVLSPPTRTPTTTRSPTFGGPTSRRVFEAAFLQGAAAGARDGAVAAGHGVDQACPGAGACEEFLHLGGCVMLVLARAGRGDVGWRAGAGGMRTGRNCRGTLVDLEALLPAAGIEHGWCGGLSRRWI